ncbi:AEC family transporter [Acinetobacter cumulans]|uniref:AEC family transporter n=1 Tax=Acinetobacter cumulans TaxID=2136182 RepID=A0ABX9U8F2_9GAMM|nr:AEC family transporter [Acinetobacter cumulans]RLL48698.1 AEC family transporter [Acinetobacter cumulans]
MNIVMALFPLIVLISMGYGFKRKKFLQPEFWANSEKLNYFVLFPVLLFNNLAGVQLNLGAIFQLLQAFFAVVLGVVSILWLLKRVYAIPVARFGVYVQSQIRFNTYIGLALMGTLYGTEGMQMFAMLIAVAIPVVNIFSVMAFSEGQRGRWYDTLFAIAKNPLILGCVVGVLFNLSGLHLFSGMQSLCNILAATSLPLGLLSVGAALQLDQLSKGLSRLTVNTFARLLIMPCLAFFASGSLGLTELQSIILVTFFALPTASASYILTRYFQGDSQLMAGVISLQTLCFIGSFPLLMWLLYSF